MSRKLLSYSSRVLLNSKNCFLKLNFCFNHWLNQQNDLKTSRFIANYFRTSLTFCFPLLTFFTYLFYIILVSLTYFFLFTSGNIFSIAYLPYLLLHYTAIYYSLLKFYMIYTCPTPWKMADFSVTHPPYFVMVSGDWWDDIATTRYCTTLNSFLFFLPAA